MPRRDYERMKPHRCTPEPGLITDRIGQFVLRDNCENHLIQLEKRNLLKEIEAKTLVDSLPCDLVFPITILKQPRAKKGQALTQEQVGEEVTFNICIADKKNHKITYVPENSTRTSNKNTTYLGFCLLTKLMIRDESGTPKENKEYIQEIMGKRQATDIPKIRDQAA